MSRRHIRHIRRGLEGVWLFAHFTASTDAARRRPENRRARQVGHMVTDASQSGSSAPFDNLRR